MRLDSVPQLSPNNDYTACENDLFCQQIPGKNDVSLLLHSIEGVSIYTVNVTCKSNAVKHDLQHAGVQKLHDVRRTS